MLHLFNHKTFKLTNIPIIELEGKAFPVISFRYPSDKHNQLQEYLQKLGILPLKKGEPKSKAYQLLIDKLLDGSLFKNPVRVTTNSEEWICLKYKPKHEKEAMQKVICDTCKAQDFNRWRACQELKQEQRK